MPPAHGDDIAIQIDAAPETMPIECTTIPNEHSSESPVSRRFDPSIERKYAISEHPYPPLIKVRHHSPLAVTQLMIDDTLIDFVAMIVGCRNDGTLNGMGSAIVSCACTVATPRCARLSKHDAVILATAVARAYINDQYNPDALGWVILHNIVDLYIQDYVDRIVYDEIVANAAPVGQTKECCIVS